MTNNKLSAQQQLNQRAKAIGAKVELFNGWHVTTKDGTGYRVETVHQLYELIDNLEKEANDNT